MTEEAVRFRVEGLRGLSRSAQRFLRQHPREARLAVAAALEAAVVQYEAKKEASRDNLPEALAPFLVQRPLGAEMIGVSEAAARLQVSRTTVYDWAEKKVLLAWKATKRGLTIPGEQILAPGKVVAGIPEILEVIEEPELAWAFLSEEWPFAKGAVRPIEKLQAGEIDEVINAAASFGTAFT